MQLLVNKMIKNTFKNKYGFSLIETMIAVSILMIAIAGPLSLVQAGLFSSNHQRNQVTAIYLAQEALEYINNLRGTNYYKQFDPNDNSNILSVSWLEAINSNRVVGNLTDSAFCGGHGCYVDPKSNYIQHIDSNLEALYQNSDGFYGYRSESSTYDKPSPYTRVVVVTPITSDEVTVTVTVSWNDGALPRSYTVSEDIFNDYNYE